MEKTCYLDNEIIALVDCNNFYASCERVFNPRLQNKPVAILSNNDGCIVSRSNEIKALGIPMGAPGFKYEAMIRKAGGVLLSSNYSLYGDMSARVMEVLQEFSPEFEQYSIDEAFMRLTGMQVRDWESWAKDIRKKVLRWTGIPVSIGISQSKTLAKIANHHSKRHAGFGGVLALLDEARREEALKRVKVADIWGIGRQYEKFLKQYGIENALEFSRAELSFIRKYMTIMGEKTVLELRGFSVIDLEELPPPKKSIVTSKSFGRLVTDLSQLEEAVCEYATRCTEKLREQHSLASSLMVFLGTNRFRQGPQYNNSLTATLFPPTAYTPQIISQSLELLREIWLPGFEYKKAGVMLAGITAEEDAPLSFLESSYLDDERSDLMRAIDKLNKSMGRDTVRYAGSGIKRDWEMKRELLSPRYTTNWKDLPKVK